MVSKNTICLWYDGTALDAAKFYAETFPDSVVGAVLRAPGDYPAGKQGDVLTVEFTLMGIPCLGLNGGSAFTHSEAFSFQIATDNQAERDRLWNAFVENGGHAPLSRDRAEQAVRYSQNEIAKAFDVHCATVSRIAKAGAASSADGEA